MNPLNYISNNSQFAFILSVLISVAIFFQLHIFLPEGPININIADPIVAITGLAGVFHFIKIKQLPLWHLKQFNSAIILFSLILLIGFFNGIKVIGITQWAFFGRILGWVILLAYLLSGYMISAYMDRRALNNLTIVLTSTACFIVLITLVSRFLSSYGIYIGVPLTVNFEGFAGNRNALAFQLLTTLSLVIGYSRFYLKIIKGNQLRQFALIFAMSILNLGLLWSGSRAGIGIGIIVLILGAIKLNKLRVIISKSLFLTIFIWSSVWSISHSQELLNIEKDISQFLEKYKLTNTIQTGTSKANTSKENSNNQTIASKSDESLGTSNELKTASSTKINNNNIQIQSELSNINSNVERFDTFKHAIYLWRESPILGAGLGVFFFKSTTWLEHPQVVHNTLLWILTELGILGLMAFCYIIYVIWKFIISNKTFPIARNALFFLLIVFLLFSLVHEIFYQRMFWLILGLLLAKRSIRIN